MLMFMVIIELYACIYCISTYVDRLLIQNGSHFLLLSIKPFPAACNVEITKDYVQCTLITTNPYHKGHV